jgi:hypothetical protein
MSYSTNTDVKVYVGTIVSDADLTAMIADNDRIILAYFTARGIGVDSTIAKAASILMTRASVAERLYLTGENPTSYSAGDYSQSGPSDQMSIATEMKRMAYLVLSEFIQSMDKGEESMIGVTRCDVYMPDFQLDQNDIPTFFTE